MFSIHSEGFFLSGSKKPQETAKSGSGLEFFCSLFWNSLLTDPEQGCHHTWLCLPSLITVTTPRTVSCWVYTVLTLIIPWSPKGAKLKRGRSYWTRFSSLSHQALASQSTSMSWHPLLGRFSLLFTNWIQHSMSHAESHLLLTQSHLI